MECIRYTEYAIPNTTRMSIQEWVGRIKGGLDVGLKEWGIPVIVVLVGFSAFGLGRLSMSESAAPVVSVSQVSSAAAIQPIQIGGHVVASRSGSAYHYPWCGGASSIKESNKVWFKSEEVARKAGYKPAKNCKGLK